MSNMDDRKVLLSLNNVSVKFNVRGRTLSAIRNVSLDIYEHENLAIVGESGSGKSVLTKTFAGMLDSNGYVSEGSIILSDDEISKTEVKLTPRNKKIYAKMLKFLNDNSVLERGSAEYVACKQKKQEIKYAQGLSAEEEADYATQIKTAEESIIDLNNKLWTLDKKNPDDAQEIARINENVKELGAEIAELTAQMKEKVKERKAAYSSDSARVEADKQEIARLLKLRDEKIAKADNEANPNSLSDEVIERNKKIAYEILLSIGRYPYKDQFVFMIKLQKAFKLAMSIGEDLTDDETLNKIFETVAFRVEFRSVDEEAEMVYGYAIIDCAKVKYTKDWQQIRGCRIATVFQDPMTSLNPVITIGKQIMTVILKHQHCTNAEARERTLDIMAKVGIPDPEKRFDDYPFEYSGGMRQRIVIAIALTANPDVLICDEPTTALDVTIQAQILELINKLKEERDLSVIFITHDLGVVANMADRIAVMYAGKIVECGTAEDVFYAPAHPYTWALLSSVPDLDTVGKLESIPGTPPNMIYPPKGDAFAERNKYALEIDFEMQPPMFEISETHSAATWLLHPNAPKIDPPEIVTERIARMKKMRGENE